jgi:hypothetical protein
MAPTLRNVGRAPAVRVETGSDDGSASVEVAGLLCGL